MLAFSDGLSNIWLVISFVKIPSAILLLYMRTTLSL